VTTTLSIYTHTIAASHREAVEAVEGRLFSNVLELPDELQNSVPANVNEHET
jgi:hypothetical protein